MGDLAYSVLLIILSSAIPAILAWLWAKVASQQQNPSVTTLVFGGLLAAAISATSITVYDRFFVSKNVVVFAHENGTCPSGYRDMSTVLMARWKNAPEIFQSESDARSQQSFAVNPDWPYDHVKICFETLINTEVAAHGRPPRLDRAVATTFASFRC